MPPKKQKSAEKPSISPLLAHYGQLVEQGRLKDDAGQHAVLEALEKLNTRLARPQGLLSFFKKPQPHHLGLYIWGNVGRGKSMLMDLFFEHVSVAKKRRVHFHAFMQEVYSRIHILRQDIESKNGGDPVARLAQELSEESSLLCFDELQASDPADATLLYRLFQGLFDAGVVIVSTSNHPPSSLYTGGVQRERFDRFIALLNEQMSVIPLSSPLDYRTTKLKSLELRYVYPLSASQEFIAKTLQHLNADPQPHKKTLTVHGRAVTFTLYNDAIGRFTFHELCETAMGPAEYLAIAEACDTILLTDIPRIPPEKRNEAKRFVTLIDALYERKVNLLCTAEVPPEQIYSEGDGSFEFKRTVSRLMEMQSASWGQ